MSALPLAPPAPDHRVAQQARLSLANLDRVHDAVRRPAFDPASLRPGILHLGCGAFHRAHQAVFTQQAIEFEWQAVRQARSGREPPAWGIISASLRTGAVARALAQQDQLFTVLEKDPDRSRATVIGSLRQAVFYPEQPERVEAALADRAIRLVTLTVTPGGYCTHAASGRLDEHHPEIADDLRRPRPRGAIGILVDGLQRRRQTGAEPPVVMSCDNLPGNGRTLRRMCVDYAALKDDGLSRWIAESVQFPSTMVDRIVPGGSAADRAEALSAIGLVDAAPVSAEPFRQWVIENFEGPRPRWEEAGAEFVPDVAPWEASKLRLLNGCHLALACLGKLAGCATVAETVDLPFFTAFALRFMLQEQKPTLPPSDHDIDAYAHQLIARWTNHGIVHPLERVARDASCKLPARLLGGLRDNLRAGRPAPCTALGIAAWMRCMVGIDDLQRPFELDDPLRAELGLDMGGAQPDATRLVDLLLGIQSIFGDDLSHHPGLRSELIEAVDLLQRHGATKAVARCLDR